ncbi:MAG: CCA tRNA nucleotidyltransferase [Planctomycetaceae bacterium]|nr:CCA tRNA nucleotidyltransferase [Planctomycetaceae bacterium]
MSAAEPARNFATAVVQKLHDAGHVALFAGGCVRDLLMGRQPQDYDVATDARPDQVRELFGHRKTLAVGESFGVVIVLGPRVEGQHLKVETATFRSEGAYLDGRRPDPDQIRFTTAEEDARRRDFTINGMFYDPLAGEVRDYVGGEPDVRAGIIRAIGRPQDRMQEDKLRMLRAIRFAATLDFEIEPATADAVQEMAPQLTVVSVERITQELTKMLVNRHRRRAVRLAQQLALLPVMLPEIADQAAADNPGPWTHILDMLDGLETPGFELALATLLQRLPASGSGKRDRDRAGTVTAITRRLRLSNEQGERVVWLVAHQQDLAEAPQLPAARLKRVLSHPFAGDLLAFMRADVRARRGDATTVEFVERYLAETPADVLNPPPLVTGADLIALGLKPGPDFQSLLERLRDEQLEGRVTTKDGAIALVRTWI